MAQIKCRHYANRTTPRKFTAKDVGRIAKYAIQDGESEKAVIVQVALRVGYLREWLIKINDVVKKVLPILISTNEFLKDTMAVLQTARKYLLYFSALFAVIGFGEFLALLAARVKVLEKRIEDLDLFIADIQDLVENFDISEILSDLPQVKEL